MMTDFSENWYEIDNVGQLDSPALVFYPERIAANIQVLISALPEIHRLRPHVKTHKSAEVCAMMIAAGISSFKCATIAEAEMLGQVGAKDVLLAYQPVGPKVTRYLALVNTYPATRFSCLFDNDDSLKELSLAGTFDKPLELYMDINVGMNRTGITISNSALGLYTKAAGTAGVNLRGIHVYDGHIHDSSLEVRQEKWQASWNLIQDFTHNILSSGLSRPDIVAGGTPTFPFYAQQAEETCSPGTFALWDKGYQDLFPEQEYHIAALVIARVISIPGDSMITLDLGHKAVAAESELTKRVTFINAPEARILSQSEEHLVLEVGKGHAFHIGDVLYGLPKHICPTVALYDRAATVSANRFTDVWKISSRNRIINI